MNDEYKHVLEKIVFAWDHPESVDEKTFLRVMREARELLAENQNEKDEND
jgi:hypothetical protein